MRDGYRILDTDAHQMEPPKIWRDFIDAEFADRAPHIGEIGHGNKGMVCEGEPLAKQDGSYPMHSEEFHAAAMQAMQRFERARADGFSAVDHPHPRHHAGHRADRGPPVHRHR